MADVLVVYFSRSGKTQELARRLAETLGADLDEVRPALGYRGKIGYFKGIWHGLLRRAPPVQCGSKPSSYQWVIIGSPVWVGRLSAPMRSYLMRFKGQIGACAAFWVSGSGRGYETLSGEIEHICGRAPFATASFAEREIGKASAAAKLETFARAIRERSITPSS